MRNSTPPADKASLRRASDIWTIVLLVYIGFAVLCVLAGLKIWAGIDGLLALYAGWRAKRYADQWARTSIDK